MHSLFLLLVPEHPHELLKWCYTSALILTYKTIDLIIKINCYSPSTRTFIYSFIHSGDFYCASSRDYYSEVLPAQSRTKKKDLTSAVTGTSVNTPEAPPVWYQTGKQQAMLQI